MKKFLKIIGIILFPLLSSACTSNKFNIYYYPLKMNFYIPPSPEQIIKNGKQIMIKSCLLTELFRKINQLTGKEISINDYKKLRILIININTGSQIFITQDKFLISIKNKKIYKMDIEYIDKVLKDIGV